MAELAFISNKTQKEIFKYFFVTVFALITWILQVSVFSHLFVFDTTCNLLMLGCIYFGITRGPLLGSAFGITSSFFITSTLYDHIFYFSYPLIGLIAGLLTKNIFSDELLFFILLSFVSTVITEFLNGWQYSLQNPINIFDRWFFVSFVGAMINSLIAPLFYYFMRFVTKKLNLR